jgi:hypothetical protein
MFVDGDVRITCVVPTSAKDKCGVVWGDVRGKWCLRGYRFEERPV